MEGTAIQGSRHAILQWVQPVTIAGHDYFRIVYRFTGDRQAVPKDSLVRREQMYRGPHAGHLVRVHFCLSQVLRVERAQ